MIQHGWPEIKSTLPLLGSPYFALRDELSIQDGLIFKEERVVAPEAAWRGLLKSIHNSHLGDNGCLDIACECLYWPGMKGEINNYVSTSEACREYKQGQRKKTLTSHKTPSRPWQFIAADLFELNGKSYLETVDYFSTISSGIASGKSLLCYKILTYIAVHIPYFVFVFIYLPHNYNYKMMPKKL